ncbi:acyltransferase family protein [Leifsonia sp. Root112D2]|uniref:acyltransferase family protein n=1 Tax=Leifsonia sp. Root112D2 TaxID=1736426 RepID=UPI0007006F41|nr:acyltransferase [Leifsonia sp. Root112D2]KQV06126.1 hypothetical protein ASC63_01150 [Leifsonia sp. Root112D2]
MADSEALPQPANRLRSLDGLRGVAALIVLVHHTFLLVPAFSATYRGGMPPAVGSGVWWISYTPLKLLTAGGEAVIVFFVLSGLVLTLPVLRRRNFNWIGYYPQRVLRLALPVLGSVLLAAVLILLIPQRPFQPAVTWLTSYSTPQPHLSQFVAAANMFAHGAEAFHVNNPLWSLSWELAFSLALPVFILLAIVAKRWWILALVAATLLTAFGRWQGSEPWDFLPSFFVGSVMAVKFADLRRFVAVVNARRLRHVVWLTFTIIAALLLIASWLTGPLSREYALVTQLLNALCPVAAGMIVLAAIGWRVFERVLTIRPLQFAGKISFSLYLTHVPVLIFTSYLLKGSSLFVTMAVGACLALTVGSAYYWLVESRCHLLARRVGAFATERWNSYHEKREELMLS